MDIERIHQLQKTLKNPVLLKKPENILYLTGRKYLNGYLLVKPRKGAESYPGTTKGTGHSAERRGKSSIVFFGDGLELPPHGIAFDRLKNLPLYLTKAARLDLEDQFTFAEYGYIKRKTQNAKRKFKIHHAKSPVDYQRQIKDKYELGHIRTSMRIVEKVFNEVKKQLRKKAWTEIRLAEFIKAQGYRFGAEDVSFPPIVASGVNAAIPHHVPTNKKIKAGEPIILDMGFKYKNYCSDFTRTVFIKSVPKRLEIAYNQVEKAYNGSIDYISENVGADTIRPKNGKPMASPTGGQAYQKAVVILSEKHLEKYFIHSLGHGTGLEIHELPNLSPKSKDELEDGMVFSIEPGVYIPNLGGIRIEDLVYLKQGKVQKFINQPTLIKEQIL